MQGKSTMSESEPTSEADLASILPDEPELFIQVLFEDYQKKLAACIGKHGALCIPHRTDQRAGERLSRGHAGREEVDGGKDQNALRLNH